MDIELDKLKNCLSDQMELNQRLTSKFNVFKNNYKNL